MDHRLRDEKRPKSAYPFKEPVKNINYNNRFLNPFDNMTSLKAAPYTHNNITQQNYFNDEKFFDNFLNQMNNGKDSKNDKSFYY